MSEIEIRDSADADVPLIEALYPAAFPDEDLLPVLRALLNEPSLIISLVAVVADELAGHILFTKCAVTNDAHAAALLAPLAVVPAKQRQGVGSALVRNGLERLRQTGFEFVLVLGDPNYYSRFGFAQENAVTPPYPIPAEWAAAWQSLNLTATEQRFSGTLKVPPQWMQPALWAP